MKQFVSKSRLQELIFICILSLFVVSCVGEKVPKPIEIKKSAEFNADYYIYKKINKKDFIELENFVSNEDKSISASAGLILGYYYLKEKDYDMAEEYIMQFYGNYHLPPYLKMFGKLIRMELSLAKEGIVSGTAWANMIKKQIENEGAYEALTTYCYVNDIIPLDKSYPFSCVETRLENARIGLESNELLKHRLDILIIGSAEDASGVLFYADKNSTNHKIRISKDYREGDWDFVINLKEGYLWGRGYGVWFKPDISFNVDKLIDYTHVEYCQRVLIGAGSDYDKEVEALKEKLQKYGNKVEILDIKGNASRGVRTVLNEWEKERFCAVGVGAEEELANFIPTVRQYIIDPKIQKVYIVSTLDSGKNYNKNYIAYYGNSYVYPAIDLTLSEDMKIFASEYKLYTGQDLTYNALIGYDIMHFINKQTLEGSKSAEKYHSYIVSFKDGKVLRPVRGFYIDNLGIPEPLEINIVYEEDIPEMTEEELAEIEIKDEELSSKAVEN